jgi:GTP cyclohydrolase I
MPDKAPIGRTPTPANAPRWRGCGQQGPSQGEGTGQRLLDAAVASLETPTPARPSRAEVEQAVRTLIAWAGDDPERPGLQSTPQRVADAFGELFSGYEADPVSLLRRSLIAADTGGQLVLLRRVRFVSFCEHHLLPFTGHVDVGYVPRRHAVGLGAVAAAVDAVARRLQIQERITDQIASAIAEALDPMGVAVVVRAEHQCLAARGARKAGAQLVTSRQLGSLGPDHGLGQAFFGMVNAPAPASSDAEETVPWR